MGPSGISIWQLLILLLIILLLFGTKRLRNLGSDLGSALKGFRKSMSDDDSEEEPKLEADPPTEEAPTRQKQESRQD